MQNKWRVVLIHVLGSLAFLGLPFLFSPDLKQGFTLFSIPPFQKDILTSVLLLLFFYANFYVFINKWYVTKKYVLYLLVVVISFVVVVSLPELLIPKPHQVLPNNHFPHGHKEPIFDFFFNRRVFQFAIIFIFSLFLKLRERLKHIEIEKNNAELAYLKAQINPHFLFNTLNSVYSLAIQKSDKTPDAIAQLSNMMRYVLTTSNQKWVALDSEINYIKNYIELQQMRLTPNVLLTTSISGDFTNKQIAPLLLIPFIENAFKHGVNTEVPSEIVIDIKYINNQLSLVVKNKIVSAAYDTLEKSGLGIANTKQRLNLLYAQKHALIIEHAEHFFIVKLDIKLI